MEEKEKEVEGGGREKEKKKDKNDKEKKAWMRHACILDISGKSINESLKSKLGLVYRHPSILFLVLLPSSSSFSSRSWAEPSWRV